MHSHGFRKRRYYCYSLRKVFLCVDALSSLSNPKLGWLGSAEEERLAFLVVEGLYPSSQVVDWGLTPRTSVGMLSISDISDLDILSLACEYVCCGC
jgi:hypothetical protein